MKIERIISGMKKISHLTASGIQEIKLKSKAGYPSEQEALAYVENYINTNGFELFNVFDTERTVNYIIVKK